MCLGVDFFDFSYFGFVELTGYADNFFFHLIWEVKHYFFKYTFFCPFPLPLVSNYTYIDTFNVVPHVFETVHFSSVFSLSVLQIETFVFIF